MAPSREKQNEYRRRWRQKMSEAQRVAIRAREREAARRRYRTNPNLRRYAQHAANAWRKANPELKKQLDAAGNCLRNHGWTLAERDAFFAKQGNVCAACGVAEPGSKRGWHTDHDHVTLAIRGILCHHCNIALGCVKDSQETLQKLIAYLGRVPCPV